MSRPRDINVDADSIHIDYAAPGDDPDFERDSTGRHAVYIGGATGVVIEADHPRQLVAALQAVIDTITSRAAESASPTVPAQWIDPTDGTVYRQYVDDWADTRFTVTPASGGMPEPTDTVPAPPASAVPLVPAYRGEPPHGVRFTVLFRDDLEEADAPSAPYTAVREKDSGRWHIDGVDRWTYDTSELLIGAPTSDAVEQSGSGGQCPAVNSRDSRSSDGGGLDAAAVKRGFYR